MSTRTFLIFLLTIATMVTLTTAGAVVYTGTIAPERQQFVGILIFLGMFSSIWLGSLAMGYSASIGMLSKSETRHD